MQKWVYYESLRDTWMDGWIDLFVSHRHPELFKLRLIAEVPVDQHS